MPAVKNIIQPIPMTSIASSSVSSTYAAINPDGLPQACSIVKIVNNSNKDITISYDGGVTDHDYLPASTLPGTVALYNFETNSQAPSFSALLPIGTVVSIKGTSGTGNIYLVGWYQPSSTN